MDSHATLDVVIVGGGVAGLECARLLKEQGYKFIILEARSYLGGRVYPWPSEANSRAL